MAEKMDLKKKENQLNYPGKIQMLVCKEEGKRER